MSELLLKMQRDMELRGFSPKTVTAYLKGIKAISRFHSLPPENITYDHVREFLHDAITIRKLSCSYVNSNYSASILNVTDDQVTFRYKDYKDSGKTKQMTFTGVEFIRRFLMHVLPSDFVKIRHYGILAGRNRTTKLAHGQRLMNIIPSKKSSALMKLNFSTYPRCLLVSVVKLPLTNPSLTLIGEG